jgi:hypothetical protein
MTPGHFIGKPKLVDLTNKDAGIILTKVGI